MKCAILIGGTGLLLIACQDSTRPAAPQGQFAMLYGGQLHSYRFRLDAGVIPWTLDTFFDDSAQTLSYQRTISVSRSRVKGPDSLAGPVISEFALAAGLTDTTRLTATSVGVKGAGYAQWSNSGGGRLYQLDNHAGASYSVDFTLDRPVVYSVMGSVSFECFDGVEVRMEDNSSGAEPYSWVYRLPGTYSLSDSGSLGPGEYVLRVLIASGTCREASQYSHDSTAGDILLEFRPS